MTPLQRYRGEIERGQLSPDPAQEALVGALESLHHALAARTRRQGGLLDGLSALFGRGGIDPVTGLYVWGGVGRGKTYLVNAFHQCLPFEDKLRIHFHRFMQHVHAELKALGRREDPLPVVADGLAGRARVICFDEFHVGDITDAMLLGRLLEALFERGVCLVATSNTAPDDLYRDGLQREQFLPAIDLIKRHTRIVHMDQDTDYRLRMLERAGVYYHPPGQEADESMRGRFEELSPGSSDRAVSLSINGRPVAARRCGEGVVWFEFRALCETPRSPADYTEVARGFHTVLLGNVPCLDDDDPDRVIRFVYLIDELYDHHVNLIVSAAARPDGLYAGRRLRRQFARTASRLVEMQSHDYLASGHLP